jgi:hypothetical protein
MDNKDEKDKIIYSSPFGTEIYYGCRIHNLQPYPAGATCPICDTKRMLEEYDNG